MDAVMLTVRIALALLVVIGVACLVAWFTMVRMPGQSHTGPLLPLTDHEQDLRDGLRRDVETLAGSIGERNVRTYAQLREAAAFIRRS